MIRFDEVSKVFPGGTVAVDRLSLTAPTGRITVLVGPSGCGKTTSLRMVNRMIEPTSGRIVLGQGDADSASGELDTHSMRAPELRRRIGYVIQHAGLFPHRSIVDNVATVPLLLGTDRRTARRGALELLERVGLDPALAGRYPAQLSGGQQQRVGVARALAADPPFLLMDEPFSAVDPVVRGQLQDEFLHLQADLGKTILFVTHDIDEAVKMGDQVVVLRVGGTIAQVADPAELLARPADEFVAGFVGRDRGYRALAFSTGHRLPVHDEPTLLIGAPVPRGRPPVGSTSGDGSVGGAQVGGAAADTHWRLVLDAAGEPQGWVDLRRLAAGHVIDHADVHRGGTLATQGGSLRAALDACLSSPSARGVVVDSDGRFAGTIVLDEVVDIVEASTERGG